MFNTFLFISLCVCIILINLNSEYHERSIAFVIGMVIGAVCNLIAKWIHSYLISLDKQKHTH